MSKPVGMAFTAEQIRERDAVLFPDGVDWPASVGVISVRIDGGQFQKLAELGFLDVNDIENGVEDPPHAQTVAEFLRRCPALVIWLNANSPESKHEPGAVQLHTVAIPGPQVTVPLLCRFVFDFVRDEYGEFDYSDDNGVSASW